MFPKKYGTANDHSPRARSTLNPSDANDAKHSNANILPANSITGDGRITAIFYGRAERYGARFPK